MVEAPFARWPLARNAGRAGGVECNDSCVGERERFDPARRDQAAAAMAGAEIASRAAIQAETFELSHAVTDGLAEHEFR